MLGLPESLRRQGIAIYRQGDSTVSHQPPEGARTFAVRALCQGYDAIYWKGQRRFGMLLNTNPVASLLRLIRQMGQVLVKVTTRARTVGLGPLGALAAIGMGFAYYLCKFAGEVVAFFTPGLIRINLPRRCLASRPAAPARLKLKIRSTRIQRATSSRLMAAAAT